MSLYYELKYLKLIGFVIYYPQFFVILTVVCGDSMPYK